jgi:Na+-transporting NADH:ubiquinone oxidoreductase subunit C
MPNKDSAQGTLLVAFILCLVCSVIVSSASVLLKPKQELNKALDVKGNILKAAGLYQDKQSIPEIFKRIEIRAVDLETGDYVDLDVQNYNQKDAAKDPSASIVIPKDKYRTGIGRREKVSLVYFVKGEQGYQSLILPVRTKGLWSTMYGFVALKTSDYNTIEGFTFYEQGETAGLGGEVDNPRWKAQWVGKKVFGPEGGIRAKVAKGQGKGEYEVDGLSGATITANGVTYLFEYWFSDHGFGKFLDKLKMKMVAGVSYE